MRRKNASLWRLVWCALLAAATVLNPFLASTAQASAPSPIVIGEVAWAGSTLSTADEWIELWNVSDAPVAVGNWSLHGMGESGRSIPLPADAVIPAQGTYVVANYGPSETKSNLAAEPQVVTTTVSLSNSALRFELYDASGNPIDSAGIGGAPPAGSSGTNKISMVRTDAGVIGATPTAWSDQTVAANLKSGSVDFGTPGICDGCSALTPSPEPPMNTTLSTTTTSDGTAPVDTTVTTVTTDEPVTPIAESLSATSTQPDTIQDQTPSTTEIVVTLPENTTSTSTETASSTVTPDVTAEIPVIASTSTASTTTTETASASVPTLQTATANPAVTTASAATSTASKPPFGMLRLNEIAPYPSSGKEWIEITSLDAANGIPLKGCELHDRQGRLLIIGAVTLDPLTKPYAVIELSSSRLNNDGDIVALYCDNRPIDAMSYASTAKGQTWIRFPDKTGAWRQTTSATPAAENLATSPEAPVAPTKTAAATPTVKTTATSTAVAAKASELKGSETVTESTENAALDPRIEDDYPSLEDLLGSAEYAVTEEGNNATKKTSSKKSAKSTSAKKTTEDPIIPLTFDMLNDFDNSPIRVRLEGAVGSTAGLLPYHSFVLLSPEGRGLQVRVPTGRKLPDPNLMVSVTGNLLVDDRGRPYLKMAAKDELLLGLPAEKLTPRIVDIELPANEDAWAYMSVTGTVKSVKARNITLDLDGVDLVMAIKPSVRYRPQRLVAGDVIRAVGLLDLTGDEPRLLPRSADDIVLLKHAEMKAPAAAPSGPTVPGWTPFGAAAGAVALTEGTKHYRKRRQQKMLERKLEELAPTGA